MIHIIKYKFSLLLLALSAQMTICNAQLGEPIKSIHVQSGNLFEFVFTIGADGIVHYVQKRTSASVWVKKGSIRSPREQLIFTQLASGTTAEGYYFLFGLTTAGKLYKSYYDLDSWSNWVWFETPVTFTRITTARNMNEGLTVIGLNAQGNVYYTISDFYYKSSEDGPRKLKSNVNWSAWKNLNALNLDQVTSISYGISNRAQLLLFARNKIEGSVYYMGKSGFTWGSWLPLGGTALKYIESYKNQNDRVTLLGVGGDGRLYERHQVSAGGPWSDWTTLGGENITQITCQTSKADRLTVFALHADGTVDHCWQIDPAGDSWSGWVSMDASQIQSIASGKSQDGLMFLMAIGGDGKAYFRWQAAPDGYWENWGNLSNLQLAGN